MRSLTGLLLVCLLTAACRSAGPVSVSALAGPAACSGPRSIDEAFQCARRDPNALRALVLAMPKGGDLHSGTRQIGSR